MTDQIVINNLWDKTIEWLLPARCPVTGDIVERQGMIAPSAWARLRFLAAPQCGLCGIPLGFSHESPGEVGLTCADCLTDPPPFAKARASVIYDDASRPMILGFKHADQTYAVKTFVPWLLRAGAEFWPSDPLLVPVPLHRWRLLRRRYNQSALLAQGLARESGLTCTPDCLIRTRATPTQGHLKAKDRARNVRKAFAVRKIHAERIKDRTVVLIDDVMTTGATVRECASILLEAGAAEINILTVARTVKS